MKRIIALVLTLILCAAVFAGCGAADDGKYTIGICQLVQHDALDAATKGFKDAVIAALGEENVTFDEQNASNDSNACSTIINNFVSKNVDLILANATPALQAAVAGTGEIPILGTSVTEYGVALGIKDFNGVPGGNVSGTSDLAPLDKQADMILELFPNTKKVGLLYCSSEPNSEYQVKVVKEYLEKKGVECKYFTFSDANDIAVVTTSACDYSDVIYVPTDNTVASSTGIIDGVCRPAKVPVVAGEAGTCKGCGVATLSISYYELGKKTGEMAVRILKDGEDISKMAIEYDENYKKQYNKDLCQYYGIEIPAGYEEIK